MTLQLTQAKKKKKKPMKCLENRMVMQIQEMVQNLKQLKNRAKRVNLQ